MRRMTLFYWLGKRKVPAMAKPQPVVITASRTDDGAPVYRAADGAWSLAIADARVFAGKAEAEDELAVAQAEERQVCDPYHMKVAPADGPPVPVSARERIRATGPTVRVRRPDPAPQPARA